MSEKSKKNKSEIEFEQKLGELTLDLQRTRADFENYRKRVDAEKDMARESGQISMILKLLPVIDNIERAINHMPAELSDNKWAMGVAGLAKNLEKSLDAMNVKRIAANHGDVFDPNIHDAIQFDEEANGETEVIAEELQAGYQMNGQPIRHAMVKVTRQ